MDDVARPDALAEVSEKLLDVGGHPHAPRGGELHLDWNEARSVLDEEIDFCPRRGAPEVNPRLVAPMLQGTGDLRQDGGLEQGAAERPFRGVAGMSVIEAGAYEVCSGPWAANGATGCWTTRSTAGGPTRHAAGVYRC